MEYKKLPKLWGQLRGLTWEELKENEWIDFQLARTQVDFDSLYDNRSEGTILTKQNFINFSETLNYIKSGKKYSEILDFYPDYYRNDPFKKVWLESLEKFCNDLDYHYNFNASQIQLNNSTQFLYLFDNDYGISTITNLSYEKKRKRILAKAFINQPFTSENLNLVLSFLDMEDVIFREETEKYSITLFPNTVEDENGFKLLKKILQIWKPAHIDIGLAVSRLTWQDLEPYTWEQMRSYTWGEL